MVDWRELTAWSTVERHGSALLGASHYNAVDDEDANSFVQIIQELRDRQKLFKL
jgi:hypothetical protein